MTMTRRPTTTIPRADRRSGATTIRDIAGRAGASVKTVSRVLNGEKPVSDAMRARVLDAIRELDYLPNAHARNLARGRSGTIGVAIAMSAERAFGRLFFDEVMRGIGAIADAEGLDILFHPWGGRVSVLDLYRQGKVDGLVLMNIPSSDPTLVEVAARGLPAVLAFQPGHSSRSSEGYVWVDADNFGGMGAAVRHLLGFGHRRFALLNGPADLAVCQLRFEGYRAALAAAGLPVTERSLTWDDFSPESGCERFIAIWRSTPATNRPTAIFCGDDTIALGALDGARGLGLEVPRDLSIVGFDDITLARYARPPLTTIRQDALAKGRVAAEMLVSLLNGTLATRQRVLPTELVVRESAGPAPEGARR